MNKIKNTQDGSGGALVIVIIIVAIVGALGFVYWDNFMKSSDTEKQENKDASKTIPKPCKTGEDTKATDGVFCSETLGVKLPVPEIFKGKLTKAENYEVYQGSLDPNDKTSVGITEDVYEAHVRGGDDSTTLTIAQEPLRTGYISVGHRLQNTYFDQNTGILSLVDFSAGNYSIGEAVPSQVIDHTTFFRGQGGDAGRSTIAYVGVVKGKLFKVSLEYVAELGPSPTYLFDMEELTKEFDESIKKLKKL